jgi:endonuclease G
MRASEILRKLAVLLSLASIQSYAWQQQAPKAVEACAAMAPYGWPSNGKGTAGLCRNGYATVYDAAAKIPVWGVYTLTPANTLGCVARSNAFAADASIKGGATPAEYDGTGYDKGHMAPDGDMSYNQQVEWESFLMTNMTPQAPSINRGGWKLLESSVRAWAYELNQSLVIYAGPLYGPGDKTIGKGVVVPHGYFKIVINTVTKEYAGWVFPNQGSVGNDLTKLRNSIAQIQQLSGLTFPLPANGIELQVGKEWPVNFGTFTQAKKQKCGTAD